MKKLISFTLIALLATLTLTACEGEDNRVDTYLGRLDAIDQTDLRELNYWFSENAESIDELFNIRQYYVDVDGSALDYETQVSGLDQDRFVGWAVDVNEEQYRLTFTYIWDISNPPEVVLGLLEEAGLTSRASHKERMRNDYSDVHLRWSRGRRGYDNELYLLVPVLIENNIFIINSVSLNGPSTDRTQRVYEHTGLRDVHIAAQSDWNDFLEEINVTEEEMIVFFEWYIERWYYENNE